jgi:hypothetical protein
MLQLSINNWGLNLLGPLGLVLACIGVLYLYCLYRCGSGAKRFVLVPQNNVDSTDDAVRSLQEVKVKKVKQSHYRPREAPRVPGG